jgi:hypothetical protein
MQEVSFKNNLIAKHIEELRGENVVYTKPNMNHV